MTFEKTEQTRAPDIAVKSGRTTYLVNFHFANKGKQTMNQLPADHVYSFLRNLLYLIRGSKGRTIT